MFGYIVMNKPESRFREYDEYKTYYCGLCRELKERFGVPGQISISYDMTFLVLLLDGLYEPRTSTGTSYCAIHPFRKQPIKKSCVTDYVADMNLLLTYYKCMDDWNDERKATRLAYAGVLQSKVKALKEKYPEKTEKLVSGLAELSALEAKEERNIDLVSGCFGRILAEIMAYRNDMWETSLRKIGFYLGKFIYIMDAYDDVEEDVKKGLYNPFAERFGQPDFPEYVKSLMLLMMSEVGREFEKLPVLRHADILRNILYSGVWCRFAEITGEREKKQEKK
ncbi:MAG: hypothetical protein KBT01_01725 [Clostridiales bacterium]|nr:hypothetical protein [Candidatus Blautia equi]